MVTQVVNNFMQVGPSSGGGGGGGTVTSVGLDLPTDVFTVTISPITTSGDLTAVFNSQSANTVFAAPDGAPGLPSFRALTSGDISGLVPILSTSGITSNPPVGGTNEVFLGADAGGSGASTEGTNFYGISAGSGALNADNSIFIGVQAGFGDLVDNTSSGTSILIGNNTSTGSFSNSIGIGANATNTMSNQFLVEATYNNWQIAGLDYVMPNAYGTLGSNYVLTDQLGNGTLSWIDLNNIVFPQALTFTQVAYGSVANLVTSSANLTFEATNKRLSIGGATATYGLTISSADKHNGGFSILSTGYTNNLTGWTPPSPTSYSIVANTVGIIQFGTVSNGVLQVVGFTDANAAGIQIWGVTTTTTSAGCITLKPGVDSGTNTVRDPSGTEAAVTIKPIATNATVATFSGTGQLFLNGATVPTANLHVNLNQAAVGHAAMKIEPGGVLLTTPEAGAIETAASPNHIYWTNDSGTRKQLDQVGDGVTITGTGSDGNPFVAVGGGAGGLFLIGETSGIISAPTPGGTTETWLGQGAGASSASKTNTVFVGINAGSGATSASASVFLGVNTGVNATSASNSVFFGSGAGNGATAADHSNFFGLNAGFSASAANNSNFFGFSSGNLATNAIFSNFFGTSAGDGATNASSSNFFGHLAGLNASAAPNSNFFGVSAGNGATNANNSIFIGFQSGLSDTVNNATSGFTSIAIGDNSGTGGFSKSIAIGKNAVNTKTNQFLIASTYNNWQIAGVDYVMPASGGTNGQALVTNGATPQVLSWATVGGISAVTADNGLTASSSTNVQLGSSTATGAPLLHQTYIDGRNGDYYLMLIGDSGNSQALFQSTGGTTGIATDGTVIGLQAQSTNLPLWAINSATSTNTILDVLVMNRAAANGATGMGARIKTNLADSAGNVEIASQLQTSWTTATNGSETSKFEILLRNAGAVAASVASFGGNGSLRLNDYGSGTFTGTPTFNLSVDASGNVIEVTAGSGGTIYPANQIPFGDGGTPGGVTTTDFTYDPSLAFAVEFSSGNDTLFEVNDNSGLLFFSTLINGNFGSRLLFLTPSVYVIGDLDNATTDGVAFGYNGASSSYIIRGNYSSVLSKFFEFVPSIGRVDIGDIDGTFRGTVLRVDDANGEITSTADFTIFTGQLKCLAYGGAGTQFLSVDNSGLVGIISAPIIVASADTIGNNATVTGIGSISVVPTADGTYRIGGYLNITSATVVTMKVQVNYNDENGAPQTKLLTLSTSTGAILGSIVASSTVADYSLVDVQIRAQAGTPITFDAVVTAGGVTYDVGITLEQLR